MTETSTDASKIWMVEATISEYYANRSQLGRFFNVLLPVINKLKKWVQQTKCLNDVEPDWEALIVLLVKHHLEMPSKLYDWTPSDWLVPLLAKLFSVDEIGRVLKKTRLLTGSQISRFVATYHPVIEQTVDASAKSVEMLFDNRGRQACVDQDKLMVNWLVAFEKSVFFTSVLSGNVASWLTKLQNCYYDPAGSSDHKLLCLSLMMCLMKEYNVNAWSTLNLELKRILEQVKASQRAIEDNWERDAVNLHTIMPKHLAIFDMHIRMRLRLSSMENQQSVVNKVFQELFDHSFLCPGRIDWYICIAAVNLLVEFQAFFSLQQRTRVVRKIMVELRKDQGYDEVYTAYIKALAHLAPNLLVIPHHIFTKLEKFAREYDLLLTGNATDYIDINRGYAVFASLGTLHHLLSALPVSQRQQPEIRQIVELVSSYTDSHTLQAGSLVDQDIDMFQIESLKLEITEFHSHVSQQCLHETPGAVEKFGIVSSL